MKTIPTWAVVLLTAVCTLVLVKACESPAFAYHKEHKDHPPLPLTCRGTFTEIDSQTLQIRCDGGPTVQYKSFKYTFTRTQ